MSSIKLSYLPLLNISKKIIHTITKEMHGAIMSGTTLCTA